MRNIINYSDHSVASSILKIDDIIREAIDNNYNEVFVVEESTMSSAPYFFQQCEKHNKSPKLGIKLNTSDSGSIILFPKNKKAFGELSLFISGSLSKYEMGKKRTVEFDDLLSFLGNNKGFLVLDGFNKSIIDVCSNNQESDTYRKFMSSINREDFFYTVYPLMNSKTKSSIEKISKGRGIKKIETFESFYKKPNDYAAFFSFFLKYGEGRNVSDPNSVFKIGINALENKFKNNKVDDSVLSCEEFSKKIEDFSVSNDIDFINIDKAGSLRDLVRKKWLEKRKGIPKDQLKKYEDRIRKELEVVESLNPVFEQYFLFFASLGEMASNLGIKNAIRGSAVGSYLLHLVGISSVDPVRYNLSFERFIFKGIDEYPDIDLDVSNKDVLFDKIKEIYNENAAQIAVFSSVKKYTETLQTILDGIDKIDSSLLSEGDVKLVKNKIKELSSKTYGSGDRVTLSNLIKDDPNWKNAYESNKALALIIEKAILIEDRFKNRSNSPSSSIISSRPIAEKIPVIGGVAEVTSEHCEYLGFLKIDILSSKMLDRINRVEGVIGEEANKIYEMIIDDNKMEPIYRFISSAMTTGVNQIGGKIGKYICQEVKPESFTDLMVVLGLIRMGINENMKIKPDEYIKFLGGKRNSSSIQYKHDDLKGILEETYGSIIFEEQIMDIVKKFGSFTHNEANKFRKCITKTKNKDDLRSFRKIFFERGEKNGYEFDVLKGVFESLQDKMEQFNFSKNHSASYAMITLKEMMLKVAYPAEFISVYAGDDKKIISDLYKEYLKMGYIFVPPSMNEMSLYQKTVDKYASGKRIRTIGSGFGNIELGDDFILFIKEREKKNKFNGILDFIEGVSPYLLRGGSVFDINDDKKSGLKNVIKKLVEVGYFDAFYNNKLKGDQEYSSFSREEKISVIRGGLLSHVDNIIDNFLNGNDMEYEIDFNKGAKNDYDYYIAMEFANIGVSPLDSILKKKSPQIDRLKNN